MSVLSYLQNMASAAVLSNTEKNSITKSISTLRMRLESCFGDELVDHFQFGSSTRDTILPRNMDEHSDIDYLIVFKEDGSVPQTFLNRLKRFADNNYRTSEIRQSKPTIVLELNHIKFDLVPAIPRMWLSGYKIPDSDGGWMGTNPNDFNQDLIDKNKSEGNFIKPTIRLMKYWNAANGYPFESYGLEKRITDHGFWSCASQKDYLFYVFDRLNPSDCNRTVGDKVERAKTIVAQIRAFENQDKPVAAESKVRKLIPE